MAVVLLVNLVATLMMTAIVTFVHVCQYPLLTALPPEVIPRLERAYTTRAGYVIAPLMLIEAACGIALVVLSFTEEPLTLVNAVLLAFIWFVTFFVSVPMHEKLSIQWDSPAHTRLMDSNRARLVAWILRAGLALVLAQGL
jgi:hypothetical protein